MKIEVFLLHRVISDDDVLIKYQGLLFNLCSTKEQVKLSDCILELSDYNITNYNVNNKFGILLTFKCTYENDTFNRNNIENEINDFLDKSLNIKNRWKMILK